MSDVARLFRMEARHNPGLWLFPLITALTILATIRILPAGPWLWPQISVFMRQVLLLVLPLVAALSAWAAGGNRRRGMEELLASTSRPPAVRDLSIWGAAASWYVVAYATAAGVVLLSALLGGAWGWPMLWPELLSVLAILTFSAFGYATGTYVRSRFAAPLVAVITYLLLTEAQDYAFRLVGNPAVNHFSPASILSGSVFYGVRPNIFFEESLWLIGIAGAMLAVVALKWRRDVKVLCVLLAALSVAALGAVLLLRVPPDPTQGQVEEARGFYNPVCDEGDLSVCVHPTYEAMLPETAAVIRSVAGPLVGMPGGPAGAEQAPDRRRKFSPGGSLPFFLYDEASGDSALAETKAMELSGRPSPPSPGKPGANLNDAQAALAAWLLQQADRNPDPALNAGEDPKAARSAAQRFGALDPATREKWLAEHYTDLWEGKITLKDFPS